VPIREFTDAQGVTWKVWSTTPMLPGVAGGYREGWLTFESSNARRRLAPIPSGWEDAAAPELRALCERAKEVSKTPHTGSWRIEPRE
jgi:hypothetical protein